jgi:TRAP-type transport system small permease protein
LYDNPAQSSTVSQLCAYRIVRRRVGAGLRIEGEMVFHRCMPAEAGNANPDSLSSPENTGGTMTSTNQNNNEDHFSGVIGHLARVTEIVMVVLTICMVSLVSYQVFERYVLHYTPPWSEELSVYLMIWFGMLGIAAGVRRGTHMSLHFFADKLPKKVQSVLEILKYLMILVYVSVLLWQGIVLVRLTMPQTSAAMDLRIGYVYLSLPVSATLIIIYVLEKLYNMYFNKEGAK